MKRVIPTLLFEGADMMKGRQFRHLKAIDNIASGVARMVEGGAKELILFDLLASLSRSGPHLMMVRELAYSAKIPLTIGGGVRTLEHVERLLDAGAAKASICTEALKNQYQLIKDASKQFGSERIVAVVEYTTQTYDHPVVTSFCATRAHVTTPLSMAQQLEQAGAGEIILSCVPRDGMMEGYDLDMIGNIARAVKIPVIALGGAGTYQHMLEAIEKGAQGVAAGTMFLHTDQTPQGATEYLIQHGV